MIDTTVIEAVARALDSTFNPEDRREYGFLLMVFPFGVDECLYISNCPDRDAVLQMLKDQVKTMEEEDNAVQRVQ